MVMTFDSSRRPCDSDAFATSSYEMNFAQPLSADTLVRAAVSVVLPWSMWPMVPTFTCGLLRSNFSLAMSSTPLRFYSLVVAHPPAFALRFGGMRATASVDNLLQPSRGLPSVAHVAVSLSPTVARSHLCASYGGHPSRASMSERMEPMTR